MRGAKESRASGFPGSDRSKSRVKSVLKDLQERWRLRHFRTLVSHRSPKSCVWRHARSAHTLPQLWLKCQVEYLACHFLLELNPPFSVRMQNYAAPAALRRRTSPRRCWQQSTKAVDWEVTWQIDLYLHGGPEELMPRDHDILRPSLFLCEKKCI